MVNWYYSSGKSASIDLLLEKRDLLSCNVFFITEELTDQIQAYKEGTTEIETNITRDKLIYQKDHAPNKSRDMAKNGYKTRLGELATTDAIVKKIERILKSCDTVLQAMQQRISWENKNWDYQLKLKEYDLKNN